MNNRQSMYLKLLVNAALCIIVSTRNIANAQHDTRLLPPKCPPMVTVGGEDVIYAGIDNMITVVPGDYTGTISVRMEDQTVISSGPHFKVNPKQLGPHTIYVTIGGKTTNLMVRVERTPDPELMVGRMRGGKYSTATFKMEDGLTATFFNPTFDIKFEVISYTVGVNGGTIGAYREAANKGAKWSGEAAQLISKAGPGTSVFFNNIIVKGTDGVIRNLGTIAFQLI